jgi:chorismate mutase
VSQRDEARIDDLHLATLRAEIDDLDARIVDLLHERAARVRAVGARKRLLGLPALDPAREREMADRLARAHPRGLGRDELARILAFAMRVYRRLAASPDEPLRGRFPT